jgi:glycosyltransferase involved in cell wall biosynthesis
VLTELGKTIPFLTIPQITASGVFGNIYICCLTFTNNPLNQKPLISVIIPCYNQAQFLPDTLRSIYEQSYPNWECIIVNDGSPDNTEEIALQWTQKDPRYKYIQKENGGLSSARNVGLNMSQGEYIQFLDSDDFLKNTKFEESIANAEFDIILTNFEMFSDSPSVTTPPYCNLQAVFFSYKSILSLWDVSFTIPIHCGLFNKKLLSHFLFDEQIKAKEDWLMWIHLFSQTNNIKFIDSPLALYRLHVSSMTQNPDHMNANTEKVYKYLYHKLPEEERTLLFEKTLQLYLNELSKFPFKGEVVLDDYKSVERGRKAYGGLGNILFRFLRKTGSVLLKKDNQ